MRVDSIASPKLCTMAGLETRTTQVNDSFLAASGEDT